MGLFRYEAVDRSGKVLHGAMDARDELQVRDRLTSMGYAVQSIVPPEGAHRVAVRSKPAAAPTAAPKGSPVSVRSVVGLSTLARFFRQLATTAKSGVPLDQALGDMSRATGNRHLRRVMPQIQQAVENGQKLSGAMAPYPSIFPVHAISSVWAGELTGKLDVALDGIAAELESEAADDRFGRLWWIITKITVVSCVFMFPLCDLSKILAPAMNTQSTNPMGDMTAIAGKIALQALPLAFGLAALFAAWTAVKRVPSVRRVLDSILLYIPMWGKLHKYRSVARFFHVLTELHSAGISPGAAWDAASLTARNNEVASKLRSARTKLAGVEKASDLFRGCGVLEMDDVAMAMTGERAGRLPDSLDQLARIYDEKVSHQKAICRTWSVSAFITSQLIVSGIAVIMLVYSYFVKMPAGLGLE